MSNRYAFGDNPAAARRLARLAELFAPTSRAFIARAVAQAPRLALDLGCGTGHTTRLLAETTAAERTVGLDRSRAFLSLAREQSPDHVTFVEHDVTTAPFPVGPAGAIFARYLLSHLADPETIVAHWLAQVEPGGVLLVEENEEIRTAVPVFRDYLARAAALIREHGGDMAVGPRLARLGGTSNVVSLRTTRADAAQLFLMNLEAQGYVGPLRTALLPLTVQTDRPGVEWRLRQAVFSCSRSGGPRSAGE